MMSLFPHITTLMPKKGKEHMDRKEKILKIARDVFGTDVYSSELVPQLIWDMAETVYESYEIIKEIMTKEK